MAVSLNTPPASGVSPTQAAKELRVLIKQWMQSKGVGKPSSNTSFLVNQGSRKARIDTILEDLSTVLKEAEEAGKQRKSALVKSKLVTAEMVRQNLRSRINTLDEQYRSRLSSVGGQQGSVTEEQLARAYALVQVLPVIADSPGGKSKAENTLRAMLAILKAHHGLLEHGPEDLPTPDMPIVLLREVEKAVEEAKQEEEEEKEPDVGVAEVAAYAPTTTVTYPITNIVTNIGATNTGANLPF